MDVKCKIKWPEANQQPTDKANIIGSVFLVSQIITYTTTLNWNRMPKYLTRFCGYCTYWWVHWGGSGTVSSKVVFANCNHSSTSGIILSVKVFESLANSSARTASLARCRIVPIHNRDCPFRPCFSVLWIQVNCIWWIHVRTHCPVKQLWWQGIARHFIESLLG